MRLTLSMPTWGLSHRRKYEVDTFDAYLSPKDHPIYL